RKTVASTAAAKAAPKSSIATLHAKQYGKSLIHHFRRLSPPTSPDCPDKHPKDACALLSRRIRFHQHHLEARFNGGHR
ncbi:MAG: hypothetical protein QNL16_11860, partial [Rhodobacterales bacterium]